VILTLPVCPSSNRWWRKWRGRMVKSEQAREYQANAATLAIMQRIPKIDKPLEVCVTIRWFREALRGDLDKRYSIMLDALQGVSYDNDSQIAEIHAYRHLDRESPRMEVIVTRLGTTTR